MDIETQEMKKVPVEHCASKFSLALKVIAKTLLYLADFAAMVVFGGLFGGVLYTELTRADSLDFVGYCFCAAGVIVTGIPLLVACVNQWILNKRKHNPKCRSLKTFNSLLLAGYPLAQFFFLILAIGINARYDETGAENYANEDFITLMCVGNGAMFFFTLFVLILTLVYRNRKV